MIKETGSRLEEKPLKRKFVRYVLRSMTFDLNRGLGEALSVGGKGGNVHDVRGGKIKTHAA